MLDHLKKLDRQNRNFFTDVGQWAAVTLSAILVTLAFCLHPLPF